ncbi:MAG: hypothetical protein IJA31_02620, partial [Clostridia bacterium]|nr:hypothetical protein [Clostridia bacterium]
RLTAMLGCLQVQLIRLSITLNFMLPGHTVWFMLTEEMTAVEKNQLRNEAQFITDLNEQFIGNEKMSAIEWELEKFFYKYRSDELTEEYIEEFRKHFDIESENRQNLVNYLVHLEGIAALVKNKILHIEMIDDLMSYRYFIAMNNPIVQKLELNEYSDFYKGCFGIYNAWVKELKKQKIEIPMYKDYKLIDEEEK